MKYLKIMIIFVIIIIIGLVIYINYISNNIGNNENNNSVSNFQNTTNITENNINSNTINNDNEITREEGPSIEDKMNITGRTEIVTSTNMFYIIQNCLQKYINDITSKNNVAVYNQLSTNYISLNGIEITNVLNYVENISGSQEFRAVKMNYVQGEICDQYSVYGKMLSNTRNITEMYFIVNINTGNLAYSIIPQISNNYSDLSQITISVTNENINKTSDNQATYVRITDEQQIKNIMKDYQKNALYDTQNAYKSLDSEYSKSRFINYSDYFNYVRNNIAKIQDLTLVNYSKTPKVGYTQYICEDTYGNVYTVNATGIMEYTIILDDYTLENISNYINLSSEQKVNYNVNKVIKMLNTCDYSHLYNLLNDNFKINNFATQTDFENYAKQNLFDYNILSSIDINLREDGIYVCQLELKDRVSVAANTMTKTIIMKLGSGTNFEMSFDI